jgi:hypothetical protein
MIGCKPKPIQLKLVDTLAWPAFEEGASAYHYFESSDTPFAAAFNADKSHILVASLDSTSEVKQRIPLIQLTKTYHLYMRYFLPHSRDTFVLLGKLAEEPSKIYRHLLLIDSSGALLEAIDLNSMDTAGLPYALYPNHTSRILLRNRTIYLFKMFKEGTATDVGRSIRYSQPAELSIDISVHPPQLNCTFGWFPQNYIRHNYRDYWPARCFNNKGELVYGFGASPDLAVQGKDEKPRWVRAKSKEVRLMNPYFPEKEDDFAYYQRYFHEEPRYEALFYDRYRDVYYRLVRYRSEYEKKDGTLADGSEIRRGILFLDNEFKVLAELPIDSNHTSLFGVTPKGFLLTRRGVPLIDVYEPIITYND